MGTVARTVVQREPGERVGRNFLPALCDPVDLEGGVFGCGRSVARGVGGERPVIGAGDALRRERAGAGASGREIGGGDGWGKRMMLHELSKVKGGGRGNGPIGSIRPPQSGQMARGCAG